MLRTRAVLGLLVVSALAAALIDAVSGTAGIEGGLIVSVPVSRALGAPIPVTGSGATPRGAVMLERRSAGRWVEVARRNADDAGRFHLAVRLPAPRQGFQPKQSVLRVRADGREPSAPVAVRHRTISLAAVGDVNLGDKIGDAIKANGSGYPWRSVGATLRKADIAFANLECAVSPLGAAEIKQYTFRGNPKALKAMHRTGGIDVADLANNHAGDFGKKALLDTKRRVEKAGLVAVGAGRNEKRAYRARILVRDGLRIAFVGFSQIEPSNFAAGPRTPGVAWATVPAVTKAVKAAKRRADVVIAAFHWGIERDTLPTAMQKQLAAAAVVAGATAVIGGHPHVLQPIERRGRRLVAYSMGNFVFAANLPGTTSTGVLQLELSGYGVERARFAKATIKGVRPVLDHTPSVDATKVLGRTLE